MIIRPKASITVDGHRGTVIECDGMVVVVRLEELGLVSLSIEEMMFNRDNRFTYPDEPEPDPYFASQADWDSAQGAMTELYAEADRDFEWFERGVVSEDVDVDVAASYPDHVSKGDRMAYLADKYGKSRRTMYYRYIAWREGDRVKTVGKSKRPNHRPFPSIAPRYTEEAIRLSRERLHTGESVISQKNFHARLKERLNQIEADTGERIDIPRRTLRYEVVSQALKDAGTFESTIARQEGNASRSKKHIGECVATRPGQFFLVDTTRLDVHALSAFSGKWHHVELTLMIDLYSRVVVAARLSPVSTGSLDIALLFHDMFNPRREAWTYAPDVHLPTAGLPDSVLLESLWDEGEDAGDQSSMPVIRPETIVTDNGKVFTSHQVKAICAANRISLLRGRVLKGSDKGQIERMFKTIRTDLIELLCGSKGYEVGKHGRKAELNAAFFLEELDGMVRQYFSWYHRTQHAGLSPFAFPGQTLSPQQKLREGIARSGLRMGSRSASMSIDLLPVKWVTIQHYGVQIRGLKYNGPELRPYVRTKSVYRSKQGKWPIAYNPEDRQDCFFQDPETGQWHALRWAGSDRFSGPFSDSMRRRSLKQGEQPRPRTDVARRDADTAEAMLALVHEWEHAVQLPAEDDRILLRMSGYTKPWRRASIAPSFRELFRVTAEPTAMGASSSLREITTAERGTTARPALAPESETDDDDYYEGSV
ncbi:MULTISPECIES: DDE-type integrase/transposase/recombinase [unclassified Frigoribacterium]|uniref:DDE-type integrase/transposase/recombinase n=1 Tax=unclassified Frigoribacterium TaxID=2627005 RepID=UPI0015665625|nr:MULTISPECIES: DDE-type integrase/transposase/recombinase [unclassified Frigoribacterium]NQW87517.1 DDE-type integrase/transposase/recombinase [Frigoribacterium sp. VKM Ac-2860]NQX09674.1 DDE-type integrase/transposase/recombinase [Frigoribacterium sp. VKM Ac-2859]